MQMLRIPGVLCIAGLLSAAECNPMGSQSVGSQLGGTTITLKVNESDTVSVPNGWTVTSARSSGSAQVTGQSTTNVTVKCTRTGKGNVVVFVYKQGTGNRLYNVAVNCHEQGAGGGAQL